MAGGTIRIKNISSSTIEVSIDSTTVADIPGAKGPAGRGQPGGGSSDFFKIAPGTTESWQRSANGAYKLVIGRGSPPTFYQEVVRPGDFITYIGPGYPSFGYKVYQDISVPELQAQERMVALEFYLDQPRPPFRQGGAKVGIYYYLIRGQESGKMMSIRNASTTDGDPVVLATNNYADHQLWRFDRSGDGEYYYLINKRSGKALTVHGGGPENGAILDQWTPLNQDNQKWRFEFKNMDFDSPFALVCKVSGKLATVHGGGSAEATPIDQWENCGSVNQYWILG